MKKILFVSLLLIFIFSLSVSAENYIPRQDFIKMINESLDISSESLTPLSDVLPESEYFKDIRASVDYGYIKGDENGNINPKSYLTRAEAVVMLGRIMGAPPCDSTDFKDDNLIYDWAKPSVKSLTYLRIITGHDDFTFRPDDFLTYEQCEIIINRIKNNLYGGGKGTKQEPYKISTFFHLRNIALNPKSYYELKNDINLLNTDFIFYPINSFSGEFDGGGYRIIGLNSLSHEKHLFSDVQKGGVVKNLKLSTPERYMALADVNSGTILNCANISGRIRNYADVSLEYVGNICNTNYGEISNCYNSSVIAYSQGVPSGICGINRGKISNCFNTGDSTQNGAVGICALNYGSISDCFNTGLLSGSLSRAITLKNSQNKPENCYYTSNMVSSGEQKISNSALVTAFINIEGFELLKGFDIPTLKSNPYYSNENYTDFGGGDGSEVNPFIISEKSHFLNVKNYPDSCFLQVNDISLSGLYSLTPIGSADVPFSGTYDGNDFKITNLILYSALEDNLSLFGYNKGTIKNVHITDSIFYGNSNISSLVYENSGTVFNCSSEAYINCASGSGLVMTNNGLVENCAFYGSVDGKNSSSLFVYTNYGDIFNCLAMGFVKAANAGGITYVNEGFIESSCCFGNVSGNKTGLLAYDNKGEISKSYYLADNSPTVTTERNIEAFPRSVVQASHPDTFELLNFSVWKLTKEFPELISNPKIVSEKENTTDFAGGNGKFNNPYKIVTPQHFVNISKYPAKSFVILNDIDLSNISAYNGFKTIENFSGFLNGNGHTLRGLNQKGISSLIETNYGIITNLKASNFKLYGKNSAPFAITNNGVITFCENYSDLFGEKVSGIAHNNNSIIRHCVNNGNLSGDNAGGIAHTNTGSISDCLLSGNIVGNNENSKICGISSGGSILSSVVTGDLYFKDDLGKFYPISDTDYSYCYYLDRYNEKFKGNLNFKDFIIKDSLYGINFSDIWVNEKGKFPYLSGVEYKNLKIPQTFTSGDGSKENPYVILTLNDLYNIRMYPDSNYTILSDIVSGELTSYGILNNGGKGFAPIENFSGTINGNNSIIYGLEILYSGSDNAGLLTENKGTVKNLGFSGVRVEGKLTSGAVCGINYGSITNIKVLGSRIGCSLGVSGSVCGINYGSLGDCTNYSDVFAASSAGGIAGINHKTLLTSTNWGGVISSADENESYAGGITGKNFNVIEKCVNNGKIYSYADKKNAYAGGITGLLEGSVKSCYNTGDHTAKSPLAALSGGIAGSGSNMNISQVYNIGYGLTSSSVSYVGSIVGAGSGSVSNAYYDHTLSLPCGGENINEISVQGINSDMFASLENLPAFSKSVWVIDEGSTYFYPQLKENLHISKTYSDNVRDFGGGDGSITNPYRILTAEHLDNVRKYLGSSFLLMGDIDMRTYLKHNAFSPIGDNIFGFFGTFMGNGYKITGLETNSENYGGLFRQNHGEIYDLKISGGSFSGATSGAICALNTGLIYRCSSDAEIKNFVSGHSNTGGIAGINKSSGMIVSCRNSGNIYSDSQSAITGGITSANLGIVAGSINYGEVSSKGTLLSVAGGISGTNSGTVSDSANINNIIASTNSSGQTLAGGIAGTNAGTLVNCYSAADLILGKAYGGVTANNSSLSVNCYYNNSVDIASTLGKCDAVKVSKESMANPDTFRDFDFYEMWYSDGIHLPVPIETLY